MTDRLNRKFILCGTSLSELGPTVTNLRQSLYTNRTNISERLPRIAGIGQPNCTTPKCFPSHIRTEEPRKSVANKSVQVSSEEESSLLSNIKALKKENCFLRSSLQEKENLVYELILTIKTKTQQFTKDIELEVNNYKTTRQALERSQRLVEMKEKLLEENMLHYNKVNQELQSQFEEAVTSLQEQSQKEISIRDEKINRLKKQISELFKDKSWEHLMQMKELEIEWSRVREEAQDKRECEQCKSLTSALEKSRSQLTLKDRTIEELQSMCQILETKLQEEQCKECKSLRSALEVSRSQLKLKDRTIEELQSICQRLETKLQEQEKFVNLLVATNSRSLRIPY
ncbi:uncharacterized protein LOC134910336 isoform X2 [Pseudophryne corroboree]|uniref:uncharacterized protein LOC134910336 isoform X2 n=1 Tax=Pseudophryne corroboree TaxID=495146 RepID=UPI0030821E00